MGEHEIEVISSRFDKMFAGYTQFEDKNNTLIYLNESENTYEIRVAFNKERSLPHRSEIEEVFAKITTLDDLRELAKVKTTENGHQR